MSGTVLSSLSNKVRTITLNRPHRLNAINGPLIDDLHTASARFLFSGWRAEWEAPTDRDHRAILDALRAGQVEAAASVLARHVQWVGKKPGPSPSLPATGAR